MLVCSIQLISRLHSQSKFQCLRYYRPPCWCSTEAHQHGGSIQCTGLCKFVKNISTNIWSLEKRTDLKLGEVSSLSISYKMTISWLYPLNGCRIIFRLRDSASQEYHLGWKERIWKEEFFINILYYNYLHKMIIITTLHTATQLI